MRHLVKQIACIPRFRTEHQQDDLLRGHLQYSLRTKINTIIWFKICPTKNTILTQQPQKTSQCLYFSYKNKRQFDNLHLILFYVFGPRIEFILGRREYIERISQFVTSPVNVASCLVTDLLRQWGCGRDRAGQIEVAVVYYGPNPRLGT